MVLGVRCYRRIGSGGGGLTLDKMKPWMHIAANVIILIIGILIWVGNNRIKKHIRNDEPTHSDYLYRLHLILGVSEFEIFKIAAREHGTATYLCDDHFARYVKYGSLPTYLKKFLDDGKEHIKNYRIKTWVW